MVNAQDKCGCAKTTFAPCMVSCAKCGEKGHSLHTFQESVRPGARPRFACIAHDEEAMQARVRAALDQMPPTLRSKRERAKENKRRLAELLFVAGSRFKTHYQQAALVESAGLGGAAASAPVRLQEGTAAV